MNKVCLSFIQVFLFIGILQFLAYKPCTCFVRLILFPFLKFFFMCPLIVCRDAVGFYLFILYPMNPCKFTYSINVFVGPLKFCTQKIDYVICKQQQFYFLLSDLYAFQFLFFFFFSFSSFFWLIALATSMLNSRDESRHPYIAPSF